MDHAVKVHTKTEIYSLIYVYVYMLVKPMKIAAGCCSSSVTNWARLEPLRRPKLSACPTAYINICMQIETEDGEAS